MFLLILFIINKFIDFVAWMSLYMHVFIYSTNIIHTYNGTMQLSSCKIKKKIH